jgi:integrase
MPEALTDHTIRKLEPRAERYEVADGDEPGLRLRVYPSGARAWSFWYRRSDGAARRIKLGRYPDVTLAKARKKARAHAVSVDNDQDPAAKRDAEREAQKGRKTAKTFADVCAAFVTEHVANFRPATRAGWQRYIDSEIVPELGKMLPKDITAEHVAQLKDRIARGVPGTKDKDGKPTWKRKPAPVSARRCFEVMRRVLEWAATTNADVTIARRRHGLERLAVNPATSARGFGERKARRSKTRAVAAIKALSDTQLAAVFAAAEAEAEAAAKEARAWAAKQADRPKARRVDPEESVTLAHAFEARRFADLLALVAHTAVRAHDAMAAKWEHVDIARKVWTIPEHKTSDHTGAPHLVPLSTGALDVLGRVREANLAAGYGKSDWLFPADVTKPCPVCEVIGHADKDSKATKRVREAAKVEGRGLLHRMRDTIKTRMSEHGTPGPVSEMILAHVPPGIAGTYDHAELLPGRRDALEWWSGELARIITKGDGGKRAHA